MKKLLFTLLLGVTFTATNIGTADAVSVAELQAQINSLLQRVSSLQSQLTSSTPITQLPQVVMPSVPEIQEKCLRLSGDLYYGMRDYHVDGAISDLQRFLSGENLLNNSLITGFFGPRTIQAVKAFQAKQGIVSYGGPETTGFGRVGPSTRKAMQRFCNATQPPIYACTTDAKQCSDGSYVSRSGPQCQFAACPSSKAQLTVEKSDGSDGKIFIFTSTHGDISSYQPSFSDGQDTLLDFGDGSAQQWVQCQASGVPGFAVRQCSTLVSYKHEYKTSGTYTARLIRSGGYCPAPGCPITELARVTVSVDNGITACTREYAPVCGQPQECSACPAGAYCANVMFCAQPQPKTYSNRCELGRANAAYLYSGTCTQDPQTNTAPIIDSFEGPTNLAINQTGVWKITAHDKERGSLRYSIKWGDAPVYKYLASDAALPFYESSQQTTFEHIYTSAGTYTLRITVSDSSGMQTSATMTVRVVKDKTISDITNQCKSWYDGCNTCSRSYEGGPAICTLRACYQQESSYCKAYFPPTTNKTCINEGDMAYSEGQSVQCLSNGYNGVRQCIADASYVCRSGEWVVEGHNQFYPEPVSTGSGAYNYSYNIEDLIQNLNTDNQDLGQILNNASGILNSLFAR